jgi:hypothetical protein
MSRVHTWGPGKLSHERQHLPRRRRDVDGKALCDVGNVGVLHVKLVRRVVQIQREPVRGSGKRGGFHERAVRRYNDFDPLGAASLRSNSDWTLECFTTKTTVNEAI